MARLQDVNATVRVALPAAGATAETEVLDLKTNGIAIGPVGHQLGLHLAIEACPDLVDDKQISVEIKHASTEDGEFAVIPGVGNIKVTGAGGDGGGALELEIYLPPHTLGFIKAAVTSEAGAGDNTAKYFQMDGRI